MVFYLLDRYSRNSGGPGSSTKEFYVSFGGEFVVLVHKFVEAFVVDD